MSGGAGTAILAALARLEAKVDALAAHLGAGPRATVSKAGEAGSVASAMVLDGEHGDKPIKVTQKALIGIKGRRLSECTPEQLDEHAGFCDWKADMDLEDADRATDSAEQAKKRKFARFSRQEGACARGWAKRLREGWKPAAPANPYAGDGTPAENPWAKPAERPQTRTNAAVDDRVPFDDEDDPDEAWGALP